MNGAEAHCLAAGDGIPSLTQATALKRAVWGARFSGLDVSDPEFHSGVG